MWVFDFLTLDPVLEVVLKHYRTKHLEIIVKPSWLSNITSIPDQVVANVIDHVESGQLNVKTKEGNM